MKHRIIGIDVARALAVIGMVIVNFKVVLGAHGPNWLKLPTNLLDGKSAATFVVLAGIGLALMTNSAIKNNDYNKLKRIRRKIIKRAFFLCLVGISYLPIWPADILHFYGAYMMVLTLLLLHKANNIIVYAIFIIVCSPILMLCFNYETGWNFKTLNYIDLWTVKGFLRNLFFNGFHPVIPWISFMLFGYWFGKQDLNNNIFIKKVFKLSIIAFIAIQGLSFLLITIFSDGQLETKNELTEILGTSPMPPLPIYMFNGIALAFALISGCILIAKQFKNNLFIKALNKTGQMALTFYVAHVIIGMGLVEIIAPSKMGNCSIIFSISYALTFSLLCIIFAIIWLKHKKSGPLEWLMRKITG